jgi:hypothetical protein
MAEEKKFKEYFPDFQYRFFPIVLDEREVEGIQGPVYRPSGELLKFGEADTIEIKGSEPVFHDGDAKVMDLSTEEFDLNKHLSEQKVLGYIPCPACKANIPITSEKRPLKITLLSGGFQGPGASFHLFLQIVYR